MMRLVHLLVDRPLSSIGVLMLVFVPYHVLRIFVYPYWKYRALLKLKGPVRHPIAGNITNVPSGGPERVQALISMARQYGDYVFWFGPSFPMFFLSEEESIRKILTGSDPKGSAYEFIRPWIGDGLIISNGPRWQAHRKLLTPTFHFDPLRGYTKIFAKHAEVLLSKLSAAAQSGAVLDVSPLFYRLTLDTLGECIFSVNFRSLEHHDKENQFLQSVHTLTSCIFSRLLNPLLHSDLTFALSPLGRKFKKALNHVHAVSTGLIKSRMAAPHTGSTAKDFLDILLEARYDDGTSMPDQVIQDEIDTFLFAGHDTTATALSWCFVLLSEHPQVADRVAAEARATRADRKSTAAAAAGTSNIEEATGAGFTWDELQRMEYLGAVVKEVLRMYPPVTSVTRRLTQDIELHGVTLPAGLEISIETLLAHRSMTWGDPDTFRPERFIDDPPKHHFAYVPFSAGSRNCIGQRLAQSEIYQVLAMTLERFILQSTGPVQPVFQIMLRPLNGVPIKLIPRP